MPYSHKLANREGSMVIKMKKIGHIILFIWCALAAFISPIWLTAVFLHITGLIYQYDAFVDEGVAGILGIFGLVIWIVAAMIPFCFFFKYAKSAGRRETICFCGILLFLAILCMALCGWDMVRFLTAPVSELHF